MQKNFIFLADISAKACSPYPPPALTDMRNFFFQLVKICFRKEKGLKQMILEEKMYLVVKENTFNVKFQYLQD